MNYGEKFSLLFSPDNLLGEVPLQVASSHFVKLFEIYGWKEKKTIGHEKFKNYVWLSGWYNIWIFSNRKSRLRLAMRKSHDSKVIAFSELAHWRPLEGSRGKTPLKPLRGIFSGGTCRFELCLKYSWFFHSNIADHWNGAGKFRKVFSDGNHKGTFFSWGIFSGNAPKWIIRFRVGLLSLYCRLYTTSTQVVPCRSCFEPVIHFCWILQRMRETWSSQILSTMCITSKWNIFLYSITHEMAYTQ